MLQFLQGKKTYIVAAATIIYAVVYYGWQLGQWSDAANIALAGLGGMTLRAALAKLISAVLASQTPSVQTPTPPNQVK